MLYRTGAYTRYLHACEIISLEHAILYLWILIFDTVRFAYLITVCNNIRLCPISCTYIITHDTHPSLLIFIIRGTYYCAFPFAISPQPSFLSGSFNGLSYDYIYIYMIIYRTYIILYSVNYQLIYLIYPMTIYYNDYNLLYVK